MWPDPPWSPGHSEGLADHFWRDALCAVVLMGMLFVAGCVSEADQRQRWQDCGAVAHEECWQFHVTNPRACEYEYYKECINGG